MSSVKTTVILPVYRGEQTLAAALQSVLSQEVEDLQVLVLDDGSPDASWEVIKRFTDRRIFAVKHLNRGLAATLNRGIALAEGCYIARQDHDDLVLEGRLAKQAQYLDMHPEVAMVGTWAQVFVGGIETQRFHRHPSSNEALQLELLFDNPFVHSSMMIRTNVLRELGGYCEDKQRQPPEDYELWSRVARRYKIANLPEVLTIYREMPNSMSRVGPSPFLHNVIRISSENIFSRVSSQFTAKQCLALADLYHGMPSKNGLTKKMAFVMFDAAAHNIAGPKETWSIEFQSSYRRLCKHLQRRLILRDMPPFLLTFLRKSKRCFRREPN
ncbi:glycosyltransferase [Alcaligenaceae bacterium]|nr:glycosyltransferase [Alcaligenaceae bacterium]